MAISVQREAFDADHGFHYYISFKPPFGGPVSDPEDVYSRVPVEATLSVSDTGDLADFSFVLPKPCRSELALTFIRRQTEASISPPKVHVAVPGPAADAMTVALASLELDLAGRIIGVDINWMPDIAST